MPQNAQVTSQKKKKKASLKANKLTQNQGSSNYCKSNNIIII